MEESTLRSVTIYDKATSSIKSHQFLSEFFVSIVLIFCEPSYICLYRFCKNYFHSKCMYGTEAVFENRQTLTRIHLPTVRRHNVLSVPIERGSLNAHAHINFTCIQHRRVNGKTCQKRVGAVKVCTSDQ